MKSPLDRTGYEGLGLCRESETAKCNNVRSLWTRSTRRYITASLAQLVTAGPAIRNRICNSSYYANSIVNSNECFLLEIYGPMIAG